MNSVIRFFLRFLPKEVIPAPDGKPYLIRYTLFWSPWLRAYIHNILRSDDDRELHSHPWAFTTRILENGYIEHMPDGAKARLPGQMICHQADDLHRIELFEGKPAWTFVTCGPKTQEWGFQTAEGWVPWYDFLDARDKSSETN